MSDEDSSFTFSIALGEGASRQKPVSQKAELHVVLAAELLPRAEFSTMAERQFAAIALEPGDPDAVLRELCPGFRIEVSDPFGGKQKLSLDLRWDGLRALRPYEIVASVPVLQAFVEAARILEQAAVGRRPEAWLRSELGRTLPRPAWIEALIESRPGAAESPPPARTSPDSQERAPDARSQAAPRSSLDALLDRVELPGSEAPPDSADTGVRRTEHWDSPLAAIVAAVARGTGSSPPGFAGESGLGLPVSPSERLKTAFERLLRSIYRHPEVRRLERAYRGLELVSRRLTRGAPVRVTVLPLERSADPERVRAWLSHVPPAERPDIIAVDSSFRANEADLARLDAWASLGEAGSALVIAEATPSLFGATSLEEVGRTSRVWSSPEDVETLALRRVAARDPSRWLVLALNGILGRAPFSPETSRLKELPFDEDDGTPESFVIVSPVFGVALLAIRSMSQHGHPYALTGADNALSNLPLRPISEQGETAAVPLEARFGADTRRELARAGLSVFACKLNGDAAFLEHAPVLFRGPDVVRGAKTAASVPATDQLAVGRVSRALQSTLRALPDRATDNELGQAVLASVSELFPNPAPVGPEIDVLSSFGAITLRVRPHRYAGLEIEEFEIEIRRR